MTATSPHLPRKLSVLLVDDLPQHRDNMKRWIDKGLAARRGKGWFPASTSVVIEVLSTADEVISKIRLGQPPPWQIIISDVVMDDATGGGGREIYEALQATGHTGHFFFMAVTSSPSQAHEFAEKLKTDQQNLNGGPWAAFMHKPASTDPHHWTRTVIEAIQNFDNMQWRQTFVQDVLLKAQTASWQKVGVRAREIGRRLRDKTSHPVVLAVGEHGTGVESISRLIAEANGLPVTDATPFCVSVCGTPMQLALELFGTARVREPQMEEPTSRGLLQKYPDNIWFVPVPAPGPEPLPLEFDDLLFRLTQRQPLNRVGGRTHYPFNGAIVLGFKTAADRDLFLSRCSDLLRERLKGAEQIEVKPLRVRIQENPVEITELVHSLLKPRMDGPSGVTPAALAKLTAHHWPLNDIELETVISRLQNLETPLIDAGDILLDSPQPQRESASETRTPAPAQPSHFISPPYLLHFTSGASVECIIYSKDQSQSPLTTLSPLYALPLQGAISRHQHGSGRPIIDSEKLAEFCCKKSKIAPKLKQLIRSYLAALSHGSVTTKNNDDYIAAVATIRNRWRHELKERLKKGRIDPDLFISRGKGTTMELLQVALLDPPPPSPPPRSVSTRSTGDIEIAAKVNFGRHVPEPHFDDDSDEDEDSLQAPDDHH
jgi:DNA-binding NtrC family response regulator